MPLGWVWAWCGRRRSEVRPGSADVTAGVTGSASPGVGEMPNLGRQGARSGYAFNASVIMK